jgi:hypothetical protein
VAAWSRSIRERGRPQRILKQSTQTTIDAHVFCFAVEPCKIIHIRMLDGVKEVLATLLADRRSVSFRATSRWPAAI